MVALVQQSENALAFLSLVAEKELRRVSSVGSHSRIWIVLMPEPIRIAMATQRWRSAFRFFTPDKNVICNRVPRVVNANEQE